jgi:hypothetical protein
MTNVEINKELEKIYKERKSWNGGKGPFTKSAIRKRELVLIKQNLLSRIEDSKLLGDKNEEDFCVLLFNNIDDYSKLI